jgi:protein-arginine kinase activator protein McsA
MNNENTGKRLQLQEQLKREEENYQDAVKQKRDYNTLRAIRDTIKSLKLQLKQLDNQGFF